MKKFYFLILGIVLCGMVAQAQKFIRRSYRLRTTPCGPERRGVERGGIP